MSHRRTVKRRETISVPQSVRFVNGLRAFFKENLRIALLFIGVSTLLQAFIPWTNDRSTAPIFIIVGSVLLGLVLPRRFWK